MKDLFGTLTVTRIDGPRGLEQVVYDWRGGRYLHISRSLLDSIDRRAAVGTVAQLGPYRVRIIRENFLALTVTVVPEGPRAWGDLLASNTGRLLERTYRRLITTAAVWGLADWDPARVPTWRDLLIVHWAARQLKRSLRPTLRKPRRARLALWLTRR